MTFSVPHAKILIELVLRLASGHDLYLRKGGHSLHRHSEDAVEHGG